MVKNIIFFLLGGAVGSVVSWAITKKFCDNRNEEELESVVKACEEEINKRNKLLSDYGIDVLSLEPGVETREILEKENKRSQKPLEGPENAQEGLFGDHYVDYTRYGREGAYSAKNEHPVDSDEDEDFDEDDDMSIEEDRLHELREDEKKRLGTKPKIIRPDDFGMIEGFKTATIRYFEKDGQMAFFNKDYDMFNEEELELLDDEHILLGDCLEKSHFKTSDEQVMYVRNPNTSTDYEIEKVEGAYPYI